MATTVVIAPQLSAPEMLLYPSTAQIIVNSAPLLVGTIEILPPQAPLTVLVPGPGKAVPVRLESLTITEQAFPVLLGQTYGGLQLGPVRNRSSGRDCFTRDCFGAVPIAGLAASQPLFTA
jgi:hypothetical protein